MTNKELIKILKLFPKAATIQVQGSTSLQVKAKQDHRSNWIVEIDGVNEKQLQENEKSSCQNQKV